MARPTSLQCLHVQHQNIQRPLLHVTTNPLSHIIHMLITHYMFYIQYNNTIIFSIYDVLYDDFMDFRIFGDALMFTMMQYLLNINTIT